MTTDANHGMEELIGVINELQATFSKLQVSEKDMKLDLPRIAVVGSQSAGKTSVLESFVGKEFLPRGSGIVTRCPLVLQLIHAPPGSEEVAQFHHRPDKYTDFSLVGEEITRRTQELAGTAVVCETPIMLKVTSPHVLTLTLIDLPGLVSNATRGQPESIVKSIHDMVRSFVSPENTIILAISSAAEDIANSRALDMARMLDREGRRTIGVLTKLDLMDEGTDALPVLNNEVLRLKHGFIGVVNRSQRDINEKIGVEYARKKEREFFEKHPAYASIAHRCGSQYLAQRLNSMLLSHIQQCIPGLKSHVDDLLATTRKKMEQLGMNEPTMDPTGQLLKLLQQYDQAIKDSLGGDIHDLPRGELVGGARIKSIFTDHFTPYVMGMRAAPMLTTEDVRTRIRSSTGFQATFYPSEKVVWSLTKSQIKRFEEPCRQCVNYVHDELRRIVERSADFMTRFPMLKSRVVDVESELLAELRVPTIHHIQTMIEAEQAYINVNHPTMLEARRLGLNPAAAAQPQPESPAQQGGKGARPAPQQPPQQPPARLRGMPGDHFAMPATFQVAGDLSQEEEREIEAIRDLVEVYFTITKGTICDQVPKVVVLLLLQKLRETTLARLTQKLYGDGTHAAQLLAESPDVAAQRRAVTNMMKCLTAAQEVLNKVRDHHLKAGN